jgi:hypothetical protein
MDASAAAEFERMALERGLPLRLTSQVCPQQAEGVINGLRVYFRARSGAWSLTVYDVDGEVLHRSIGPGDYLPWEEILGMVSLVTLIY